MSNFKLGEYYYINKEGLDPKLSPKEQFYYYSLPAFDLGLGVQLSFGSTIDSNKFLVQQETVLISKLNPRIKRVMLVRNDGKYKSISSTEFVNLVPKQNACVDFLLYYLNQDSLFTKLEAEAVGTTNSHVRFKPDLLLKIVGKFPPLPQQHKIAKILTTIDNLIEKTESLIAKYQSIKQGMMHDLFTKGVDAKGKLRPTQSEAPELYKQSELGWIPKEWEVERLGVFTTIVRGSSPRPKGDPRYYGGSVPRLMVEDVTRDGKFVLPKVDFLTEAGAALSRPMPSGSLTLVCSGTVGIPAFLAVDACIHDGFLGFRRIGDSCLSDYLYYQFVLLKGQMDTIATHGGIFTNLTTGIVKDLQVALPPVSEQKKIAEMLSICEKRVEAEITQLAKYKNLKTALMQDLLTGKVQVSPDQEDKELAHA